jgi:hypothetical protein
MENLAPKDRDSLATEMHPVALDFHQHRAAAR